MGHYFDVDWGLLWGYVFEAEVGVFFVQAA